MGSLPNVAPRAYGEGGKEEREKGKDGKKCMLKDDCIRTGWVDVRSISDQLRALRSHVPTPVPAPALWIHRLFLSCFRPLVLRVVVVLAAALLGVVCHDR